jgi:large subunit ribosomal protein L6
MSNEPNNKFVIRIPKQFSIFYDKKKGTIIFQNKKKTTALKTKVHIIIEKKLDVIKVTNIPLYGMSNNEKKKLNATQGLIAAKIKQILLESTETFYQKLKFVGVGYRALNLKKLNQKGFLLKLGLSHLLYLNPTNKFFDMFCLKTTKMFIFGTSYSKVSQAAAFLRSYKIPEPYKGKGILYENEKIKLKEGKKI